MPLAQQLLTDAFDHHLIEVSGDPLFGLHSARFVQPGSWSVLGYIAINCATLGEAMGRIIVDVNPEKEDEFVDVMNEMKVPFFMLGHVTRGEIRVDDMSLGFTGIMTPVS